MPSSSEQFISIENRTPRNVGSTVIDLATDFSADAFEFGIFKLNANEFGLLYKDINLIAAYWQARSNKTQDANELTTFATYQKILYALDNFIASGNAPMIEAKLLTAPVNGDPTTPEFFIDTDPANSDQRINLFLPPPGIATDCSCPPSGDTSGTPPPWPGGDPSGGKQPPQPPPGTTITPHTPPGGGTVNILTSCFGTRPVVYQRGPEVYSLANGQSFSGYIHGAIHGVLPDYDSIALISVDLKASGYGIWGGSFTLKQPRPGESNPPTESPPPASGAGSGQAGGAAGIPVRVVGETFRPTVGLIVSGNPAANAYQNIIPEQNDLLNEFLSWLMLLANINGAVSADSYVAANTYTFGSETAPLSNKVDLQMFMYYPLLALFRLSLSCFKCYLLTTGAKWSFDATTTGQQILSDDGTWRLAPEGNYHNRFDTTYGSPPPSITQDGGYFGLQGWNLSSPDRTLRPDMTKVTVTIWGQCVGNPASDMNVAMSCTTGLVQAGTQTYHFTGAGVVQAFTWNLSRPTVLGDTGFAVTSTPEFSPAQAWDNIEIRWS